ncbi:MAG: AraC family transcriptional regulator [Pedobacter sp.]|nr:MAG: AraC family transcriptional regulator [Pedobacter sp.]
MNVEVINVQNKLLSPYIQAFLFLSASGTKTYSYTTFPNANLCLSIYLNNHINYNTKPGQNLCRVTKSDVFFKSRLYGFHNQPFNASVESSLDQICILFHPGALRTFTNVSFEELLGSENVFDIVFPTADKSFLEQLFAKTENLMRAKFLERFLLSRTSSLNLSPIVLNALSEMNGNAGDLLKIEDISQICRVNPSTLYRLFLADIGQAPKSFLKTIRFRKALKYVLAQDENSFTNIAYLNYFHDQPHFNKEIKRYSGYNPRLLRKIANIEQQQLAWITN